MRHSISIFLICWCYFLICLIVADTNKKLEAHVLDIDLTAEIDADRYNAAAALVYLRPAIIPQAREAFSDGVLDHGEYNALCAAYKALDDKEKPAELEDAKNRFKNRLTEQ